jgi:hypothetical protein
MTKTNHKTKKALTPTIERDSGDGYIRTALVIGKSSSVGSVDVVDEAGNRLGMLNIFVSSHDGKQTFMVDVIDIESAYTKRMALTFGRSGARNFIDVPADGNLVGVHFERELAPKAAEVAACQQNAAIQDSLRVKK